MKTANNTRPYNTIKSVSQLYGIDISNPNILINGDFSINQRGQTSYVGATDEVYTADRWYIQASGQMITVAPLGYSGITLSKTATPTGGYFLLSQAIEDYEKLRGKTLTLSCGFSNNTGIFRLRPRDGRGNTVASSNATAKSGIISVTFALVKNATRLQISIQDVFASAMSVDINWLKLECGNYATVFSPCITANELPKALRYARLSEYTATPETNRLNFGIPMRVNPTSTTITIAGEQYTLYDSDIRY